MPKVVMDVLERTLAAYLTTFLGLLLADGFDLTDVSALKAAAIAAVPAALSVIKGAIGTRFGDRTSAAWLPGRKSPAAPARKASARKASTKKTPAKKAATRKAPEKKTTPAKSAPTQTASTKSAPTKTASTKTASTKTTSTKDAAKKTAPGKAPAPETSDPAPTEESPR